MNKARDNGFTLIELLVGVGIFFVLVLALYGVVSAAFRVQAKVEALKEYRAVYQTFEKIAFDVENAVLVGDRFACGFASTEKGPTHNSESNLVLIVPGPNGLREVRYYLSASDNAVARRVKRGETTRSVAGIVSLNQEEKKTQTLIREEMVLTQSPASADQREQKIYGKMRPAGLRFQYATRGQGQSDWVWQLTWPTCSLPAAIRVELTVADPENSDGNLTFMRDIFIPRQMTLQGI